MTAPPSETRGRLFGHVAVVLFLLAVFALAVLCVGIGLTWQLAPPAQSLNTGLRFPSCSGDADCHSLPPAV